MIIYKVEWSAKDGFTSAEQTDIDSLIESLSLNPLQEHLIIDKPFIHALHEEVENDKVQFRTFHLQAYNLVAAVVMAEVLLNTYQKYDG